MCEYPNDFSFIRWFDCLRLRIDWFQQFTIKSLEPSELILKGDSSLQYNSIYNLIIIFWNIDVRFWAAPAPLLQTEKYHCIIRALCRWDCFSLHLWHTCFWSIHSSLKKISKWGTPWHKLFIFLLIFFINFKLWKTFFIKVCKCESFKGKKTSNVQLITWYQHKKAVAKLSQ